VIAVGRFALRLVLHALTVIGAVLFAFAAIVAAVYVLIWLGF